MKSIRIAVLLFVNAYFLQAQNINFSSYGRVTDSNFKQFLTLFSEKNLPISTNEIVSTIDIWHLKKPALPAALVRKYLVDEGESITGPLYVNEPDEGVPAKDIMGVFYPLYKLPTNGDYVLLVFAQVADTRAMECAGRVVTLSYDLNGDFLYLSNYTYRAGTADINAYIDEELKSHLVYVYHEVNGEPVFPPLDIVFSADEARLVDQIRANGKSSEISFELIPGQFKFDTGECRFKKVN